MTRLYISGPVTGKQHDNCADFYEARAWLAEAGYEALSPMTS